MEEFVYDVLNNDNWWWEVGRRSLVKNLLGRYGGNGLNGRDGKSPVILEIGCGAGAMLQDLEAFGKPVGVDIAEAAPQYWRERGLKTASLGDATALPFRNGQFDVVIAIDVLEHVEDEAVAIEEMRRVSRPGARLIVTVPAFQFLWSRRDEQCHHQRRYTLDQFRSRLLHGGFKINKATYINMPLFFPLLMMVKAGQLSSRRAPSLRMDYALVPPPINKLLSRVVDYEAQLLQHISLPIGSSIACVGTRMR